MSKRTATILTCDNPNCTEDSGIRAYEEEHTKDEPATGYHIERGYWVNGGGGPIPPTYACCIECVAPALQHTIKEAWS